MFKSPGKGLHDLLLTLLLQVLGTQTLSPVTYPGTSFLNPVRLDQKLERTHWNSLTELTRLEVLEILLIETSLNYSVVYSSQSLLTVVPTKRGRLLR